MGTKPKSVEDRFWPKVFVRGPDECWPWTAAKLKSGYGLLGSDHKGVERLAHRISWMLATGKPVPRELCVLHSCDNPSCVNPLHLRVGTHAENTADKMSRGRYRSATAAKTHCPDGHPYAGENLIRQGNRRMCRTCRNKHQMLRYYARRAAESVA